jgi:hypothetical protein
VFPIKQLNADLALRDRVIELAAQGYSVRQIAFELHISRSLVKRCLSQQSPHGGTGAEQMVGNSLLGPPAVIGLASNSNPNEALGEAQKVAH